MIQFNSSMIYCDTLRFYHDTSMCTSFLKSEIIITAYTVCIKQLKYYASQELLLKDIIIFAVVDNDFALAQELGKSEHEDQEQKQFEALQVCVK